MEIDVKYFEEKDEWFVGVVGTDEEMKMTMKEIALNQKYQKNGN